MKRSCFSQEQVEKLRENPNTAFVSQSSIRFTDEFKERLWQAVTAGLDPADIFTQSGYDMNDIGERRVVNVVNAITRDKSDSLSSTSKDEEIKRLTSEMKAIRHELETLKKIIKLTNSRDFTK